MPKEVQDWLTIRMLGEPYAEMVEEDGRRFIRRGYVFNGKKYYEREVKMITPNKEFMTYEEREELKKIGWGYFSSTDDPKKKAWVLFNYIMPAHYWRAREHLEQRKDCDSCLKKIRGKDYYKGYVLDIDHYSENWVYSHRSLFDQEVVNNLFSLCEPKKNKYLPDECTEYQL